MNGLDGVKMSECGSCNTRSKAVNSDNGYETSLCPKCIEIWDSEHQDDGLSECEACGVRVDALYTVWDMYSVCQNCIDNHDGAEKDIS